MLLLRLGVLLLWLAVLGAAEALRPWSTAVFHDGPASVGAALHGLAPLVAARGKSRDTNPPVRVSGVSSLPGRPAPRPALDIDRPDRLGPARPVDIRLPARAPPAR